jgi:putative endonuclease
MNECPCTMCRKDRDRYSVYICKGKTGHLYTGISTDPERRVREHNGSRKGAKWARNQRPVKLLWSLFPPVSKSRALKMEKRLKGLTRKQKLAFLRGDLPVEV